MRFDGTITLGAVLTAVSFVIGLIIAYTKATTWLENRFTRFETTLSGHASQLERQTERMDRYEERYVRIANDLQWLVGRMEGDRRRAPNRMDEH